MFRFLKHSHAHDLLQWCYETFTSDKVIEFVVMATPEDIKVFVCCLCAVNSSPNTNTKANAAYIHLADEFVSVPGVCHVLCLAVLFERFEFDCCVFKAAPTTTTTPTSHSSWKLVCVCSFQCWSKQTIADSSICLQLSELVLTRCGRVGVTPLKTRRCPTRSQKAGKRFVLLCVFSNSR